MTSYWLLAVGALVVGLATLLWRMTGPGKRLQFGSVNLYYTATVTTDEARRVGEYLVRQNFALDARLLRTDGIYQLQLICSTGQPDEKQAIACEVLAAGLADDLFAGAGMEVHICDNIFRPTAVVRHRGRFGRRIGMNAAHLFFTNGVEDTEAFAVATFLAGVGVFDDSPKIAQLNRSAEGYEFRLAVEVDPQSPEMVTCAWQMASDLRQVLKAPVAVHFGKGLLGTLLAIDPQNSAQGAASNSLPGGPYRTETYHLPDDLSAGEQHPEARQGDRKQE